MDFAACIDVLDVPLALLLHLVDVALELCDVRLQVVLVISLLLQFCLEHLLALGQLCAVALDLINLPCLILILLDELICFLLFDPKGLCQVKDLVLNLLDVIGQLSSLLANLIRLCLQLLMHVLQSLLLACFLLQEIVLGLVKLAAPLDGLLREARAIMVIIACLGSFAAQSLHMAWLSAARLTEAATTACS